MQTINIGKYHSSLGSSPAAAAAAHCNLSEKRMRMRTSVRWRREAGQTTFKTAYGKRFCWQHAAVHPHPKKKVFERKNNLSTSFFQKAAAAQPAAKTTENDSVKYELAGWLAGWLAAPNVANSTRCFPTLSDVNAICNCCNTLLIKFALCNESFSNFSTKIRYIS